MFDMKYDAYMLLGLYCLMWGGCVAMFAFVLTRLSEFLPVAELRENAGMSAFTAAGCACLGFALMFIVLTIAFWMRK